MWRTPPVPLLRHQALQGRSHAVRRGFGETWAFMDHHTASTAADAAGAYLYLEVQPTDPAAQWVSGRCTTCWSL